MTLHLPRQVTVRTWSANNNSVSVKYGALTFSLRIREQWLRYGTNPSWPEWEAFPATPWNYGLALNSTNPAAAFTVTSNPGPLPAYPFSLETTPVVLQVNPLPAAAGFASVGNAELTTAAGGFSFPILGLTQSLQLRVATLTNPPVFSPVVVENVAVRVYSHVGRTRRAHFARIFGTVTPAEDGMQVGILRITHGRGVLVAGATLHHRTPSTSKFSHVVRVRRGVYRVLVRVTNGAQVSSYGQPLLIH